MTGKEENIMEDSRKEQLEALEVLGEFNERLVKNMKIIVKELSGSRLEDTDKFLKSIIDAINWEIQVVNGTLDVLNEGENRFDKDIFNNTIVALSQAIASKKDEEMSQKFKDAIPQFEKLQNVVTTVLELQK